MQVMLGGGKAYFTTSREDGKNLIEVIQTLKKYKKIMSFYEVVVVQLLKH